MKTLHLNHIKAQVLEAVWAAGFELSLDQLQLEKTKTLEHGHFSTNVAMMLAGKSKQNPRELAQKILNELKGEWLKCSEIAGPGFINLFIEQKFYTKELQDLIQNLDEYIADTIHSEFPRTVVTDTSHPNIAKPMGVHHLLSTLIGDSIKHIYRRAGWKVIGDNFIGDLGTQFGKLMHAIKLWGVVEEIEKDPITELQKLYVRFHEEAEDEAHPEKKEEFEAAGRAEYLKLEQGDADARAMWMKIREWSLAEIQVIYDRLEVVFDVMNGESFYEDKMQLILQTGQKKGLIVEGERGALIVPSDDPDGTPVIVQKSDGATLYSTRDLARTKYWEDTWHPDVMVVVTDSAQKFHFEQVFFAAKKLGLTDAKNVNVNTGRMQFKNMKMSTRKGNILLLNEVLDESISQALSRIEERGGGYLNSQEKESLAKVMGLNSVKYSVLSPNRMTNIIFTWDKVLSFEGNSAPYLMYTLARAKSVLRKAQIDSSELSSFELDLGMDLEKELAIQMILYPEVISRAAEEFKPNLVANYLYELASTFNSFYNGSSILKADEMTKHSRLLLTAGVIRVMEDVFELLGMSTVERM